MEEKRLEELFTKVIAELEQKGYAPINIRESFDRVAPPLAWQHNWLLLFIILAAFLVGILVPPVVVLAGLFLPTSNGFLVAALLLGASGLLYYFALSAFTIHEWVKLLFTIVMSLLMAGTLFLSHHLALALVRLFQERVAALAPLSELPGAPAELVIAASFFPAPLSLTELLLILLMAYNLWPLLFWLKEKFESKKRVKE